MTARNALSELLFLADLEKGLADGVSFSGADPVFPTPYRVGEAGAAVLGAIGLAISDLWVLKGNRQQKVSIGVRAAAAAMRSALYLRINGEKPKNPWDSMSGMYPAKDGRWVSIHCNFPEHRAAALKVLGTKEDRAAAEAASASWNATELEDAIHAAGGCAGFARTLEEWGRHPHATAVATQPLLQVVKIAEAKPEPLPGGPRPLSGLRVLDLTRVLAGPTCARTLAEHGADVLKVTAAHLADSGPTEIDTGMGKLSAYLDLRQSGGKEVLEKLLKKTDVFSQSYRPGTLAARGLSPEEVARLRPGIVYVTLSAWGSAGPWSARRGFDSIVQTVSGMALAQSGAASSTSKPQLMPVSAIDYVSGYLMAFGALVALRRRATEGGSWLVRVSLARTGKWIVDRGMVEGFASVPPDLTEEERQGLLIETRSPLGQIQHLGPVLELSETRPYWERPPVALGSSPAAFP